MLMPGFVQAVLVDIYGVWSVWRVIIDNIGVWILQGILVDSYIADIQGELFNLPNGPTYTDTMMYSKTIVS